MVSGSAAGPARVSLTRSLLDARPSPRPAGGFLLGALALLAAVKAGLLVGDLLGPAPGDEPPLQSRPDVIEHQRPSDLDAMLEPAAGPPDEVDDRRTDQPDAETYASLLPAARELSPGELDVLEDLAARRLAIEEREQALELRRSLLETAEARLQDRLHELGQLKAAIEAMIHEHQAGEAEKLTRLVKIYETMKPKAAAEIFNRLEMRVLIQVVSRMREAKSSDILGRMDPVRAKELTAELARQRQLPEALP